MRFCGKYVRTWSILLALAGALWLGCDTDEGSAPLPGEGFLVVVETSLYEPLEASLRQYAETMQPDGIDVYVE